MARRVVAKPQDKRRLEAQGYLMACTDAQLRGVVETERQRIKNHGPLSNVTRVARIMLDEAEKEMESRCLTEL